MSIPYPIDIDTDDGVSFRCPCDPEGYHASTYITLNRDVLEGSDWTTCGGCGRIYKYIAHISESIETDGDNTWLKRL